MKTTTKRPDFWFLCDSPDTPAVFRILYDGGEVSALVGCNNPRVVEAASVAFGKPAQIYSAVEFVHELICSVTSDEINDLVMLTGDLDWLADRPNPIQITSLLADRVVGDFILANPPEKFLLANDGQNLATGVPGLCVLEQFEQKVCELVLVRLEAAIRNRSANPA